MLNEISELPARHSRKGPCSFVQSRTIVWMSRRCFPSCRHGVFWLPAPLRNPARRGCRAGFQRGFAMTDTNDRSPPEVQAAAKVVDKWVREREQQQAQSQPQERAVDKFRRTVRQDTPPVMPSWKDPRTP